MFGEKSKIYLKGIRNSKAQAALLPLVLVLSLVIALICFGAITNSYFHRKLDINYQDQTRLIHNANSGIQFLMGYELDNQKDELLSLALTENDTLTLYKRKWGLFEIAYSRASLPNAKYYMKAAIIGTVPDKTFRSSVYLPDNRLPLKLSGRTKLFDTLYLPEAGVTTGFMHKTGYQNTKMKYGYIFKSQKELPVLISEVKTILEPDFINEVYIDEITDSTYTFYTPITNVYESEDVHLTGMVRGNLLIRSSFVKIENTAKVNDILIIADSVIVGDGYKGSLNIIARKFIQIGKRSVVDYPSQLITSDSSQIILKENVTFHGVIAGLSKNNSVYFKAEKGCSIYGFCYINGLTEMEGAVSGNVSTFNFTVTENGKRFNYNLYNAEISFKKLPPFIYGAMGMGETKSVAKWLY